MDEKIEKKLDQIRERHFDEQKWIKINGASVPVDENGKLMGRVGNKIIRNQEHHKDVVAMNRKAINELKKMGVTYKKISGSIFMPFSMNGVTDKIEGRCWARIVEKSDGRFRGRHGNFDIYSNAKGFDDKWSFQAVLNKEEK